MHEVGLAEDVVATALRRTAGRPVRRLRLRVGAMHRVAPEAMAQAFQLATEGTDLEGATLDLVSVPATFRCADCGATTEADDLLVACSACASFELELLGGDELTIESLEYAAVPAAGVG